MNGLYIIRHFHTSWNRQGLCQGWKSGKIYKADMKLPEALFSLNEIDVLISSDLYRAKKTATFIKKFTGYKNRIKYMKEFRELNFGCFEGNEPKLIRNIQPGIYDERDFFRYEIRLLGGECILDLKERVEVGLKKLRYTNKNILLVTHGSVIHMIYSILGNKDYNQSYSEVDISFNKVHYFKL